jgi:hypothetical protein
MALCMAMSVHTCCRFYARRGISCYVPTSLALLRQISHGMDVISQKMKPNVASNSWDTTPGANSFFKSQIFTNFLLQSPKL